MVEQNGTMRRSLPGCGTTLRNIRNIGTNIYYPLRTHIILRCTPLRESYILVSYWVGSPQGRRARLAIAPCVGFEETDDPAYLKLQPLQCSQTIRTRVDKKIHDARDRYKKYFDMGILHTQQMSSVKRVLVNTPQNATQTSAENLTEYLRSKLRGKTLRAISCQQYCQHGRRRRAEYGRNLPGKNSHHLLPSIATT